ncbi:MAG TPA: YjbH domain-containing protein [Micropepsaceae bacterium]|nr:YjbH domain-containing protein [Micropepsaceae bacterium]
MSSQGRRNSPRVVVCVAFSSAVLVCSPASAADNVLDMPSPSDYGGAGLLDTRTARFFPDGYLNFTAALSQPDSKYALTFQGLPWAEFTFRYLRDPKYAGTGAYFRNFDVKIRLSNESEYWPEIAGGIQDFIGQRQNGAEYFVASKRWGDFDFTLGLGWGRFGSRGTFENPFGLISKGFLVRPDSNNPQGGGVLFNQFFHGPEVGLFGGVEYDTPIRNLKFKVEYSSDTWPNDVGNYRFPVNAGFSYRPLDWLDVGISVMHGHFLGVRLSALFDAKHDSFPTRIDAPPRFRARPEQPAGTILQPDAPPDAPKPDPSPAGDAGIQSRIVDLTQTRPVAVNPQDLGFPAAPALPPVLPPAAMAPATPPPKPGALAADVEQRIRTGLDGQKLKVMGLSVERDKLVILIENPRYRRNTEAVSRVARILSATAPAEINSFEITLLVVGEPAATITLERREIDALARRQGSPAEVFETAAIGSGQLAPLNHLAPDLFPQFSSTFFPLLQEDLFDPNNPLYLRIGVGFGGEARLTRSWFFDVTAFGTIWDNFGQITRLSNSLLPHVRSDVPLYLKNGRYGFANVSTSYYFKLAPDVYGRVSGGILEQMFAGAGGELLYRPFNARWAIGIDAWDVVQRGYRELWDMRHYQAFTGHITAYYQLPWYDLGVAVSAGQYLAGDKGATFQFWRSFSTGVQIGAWFTLTNVDGTRFGEGSFDKGIEIIIPLEWVVPFSSRAVYDMQLRPLQRDGGQRLLGDTTLYGMTNGTDYGAFTSQWNQLYR